MKTVTLNKLTNAWLRGKVIYRDERFAIFQTDTTPTLSWFFDLRWVRILEEKDTDYVIASCHPGSPVFQIKRDAKSFTLEVRMFVENVLQKFEGAQGWEKSYLEALYKDFYCVLSQNNFEVRHLLDNTIEESEHSQTLAKICLMLKGLGTGVVVSRHAYSLSEADIRRLLAITERFFNA